MLPEALNHPDYRGVGVGGKLLKWLEERAIENLKKIADGRELVLRIMFFDRGQDAINLFEELGYHFQYAEDELEYDLSRKLPYIPLPKGLTFHTWSPEYASDFYSAYLHSFGTRTKTPITPIWNGCGWNALFSEERMGRSGR